MPKNKRYDTIRNPDEFIDQARKLVTVIRNLSRELKYGTPHYTAINDLGSHLAKAVRDVTGKEPPWIGNGPIVGLPFYARRNTDDAS